VNRAILMGNLGSDPELRTSQGGEAVLKFSLATSYTWKDKGGAKQEKTDWHRCVMFGKRAEALSRHLSKGSKIAVEGRIQYGSYEDKNGDKRYTTDIIVDQLHFAGGGKGGQQGGPSPYAGNYADDGVARAPAKAPAADEFSEDDIPF
jgi:single-strand DNA-binding protein